MVGDPDLIGLFIGPLEGIGAPYMITGGVASVIYGDPRFTRDIDVVLELSAADVSRLAAAFEGSAFYVPPLEVLREEAARRAGGHFNLIHRDTGLRADVYLRGDDPLHSWAFGCRVRLHVTGLDVWLAPLEYVILRKLEYYRASGSDRHLRDVGMMLQVSGERLDRGTMASWVERRGLSQEMAAARRWASGER